MYQYIHIPNHSQVDCSLRDSNRKRQVGTYVRNLTGRLLQPPPPLEVYMNRPVHYTSFVSLRPESVFSESSLPPSSPPSSSSPSSRRLLLTPIYRDFGLSCWMALGFVLCWLLTLTAADVSSLPDGSRRFKIQGSRFKRTYGCLVFGFGFGFGFWPHDVERQMLEGHARSKVRPEGGQLQTRPGVPLAVARTFTWSSG